MPDSAQSISERVLFYSVWNHERHFADRRHCGKYWRAWSSTTSLNLFEIKFKTGSEYIWVRESPERRPKTADAASFQSLLLRPHTPMQKFKCLLNLWHPTLHSEPVLWKFLRQTTWMIEGTPIRSHSLQNDSFSIEACTPFDWQESQYTDRLPAGRVSEIYWRGPSSSPHFSDSGHSSWFWPGPPFFSVTTFFSRGPWLIFFTTFVHHQCVISPSLNSLLFYGPATHSTHHPNVRNE